MPAVNPLHQLLELLVDLVKPIAAAHGGNAKLVALESLLEQVRAQAVQSAPVPSASRRPPSKPSEPPPTTEPNPLV